MKPFLTGLAWALVHGLLLPSTVHAKNLSLDVEQEQGSASPNLWRAADPETPIGPAEICRAATALSKARRLGEIKIDAEPGKGYGRGKAKPAVLLVSYVPWPNAPPDSRLYHCKLVGNSAVLGEPRAGKIKWNVERVAFALNKASHSLTVRINFTTGKSRSKVHPYEELLDACNGCEGYRPAALELPGGKLTTALPSGSGH